MSEHRMSSDFRIQRSALHALREATESVIVTEFESKFKSLPSYSKHYSNHFSDKPCCNPRQTCYYPGQGYEVGAGFAVHYDGLLSSW